MSIRDVYWKNAVLTDTSLGNVVRTKLINVFSMITRILFSYVPNYRQWNMCQGVYQEEILQPWKMW
jgi:hypothetical protein